MGEYTQLNRTLIVIALIMAAAIGYDFVRRYLPTAPGYTSSVIKKAEVHVWDYSPEAMDFIAFADEFRGCSANRTIYEMNSRWASSPAKEVRWTGRVSNLPSTGTELVLIPLAVGYDDIELMVMDINPKQIAGLKVGDQVSIHARISRVTVLGVIAHMIGEEKKPDVKEQ
jgi:hypothetical protein